jgi:hypothetical protein
MHAVEIADGDDGAVERVVGAAFAAHHDERPLRLRRFAHDLPAQPVHHGLGHDARGREDF